MFQVNVAHLSPLLNPFLRVDGEFAIWLHQGASYSGEYYMTEYSKLYAF